MHVVLNRYSTSKREDVEVGQGGRDGLTLGLNGPETGTGERSVYARENERKGHEDRRTGTERVNKEGKKLKKKQS